MMKLFKIAFLPLLAGILLLPAASRPVRAAGSAAVEAGAGDRKRDKKKKQEADTAAKATPYIIGKTRCDGIQNQMRLFGG